MRVRVRVRVVRRRIHRFRDSVPSPALRERYALGLRPPLPEGEGTAELTWLPSGRQMAALSILFLHLAIIAFNVAGCVLIPIGAWRHWHWVRDFWFRVAHLACLAAVAVQAVLGRVCFLTLWQSDVSGAANTQPLIAGWIERMIYWSLPLWVFEIAYVVVFAYVVALWVFVRPLMPGSRARR